MFTAPASVAFPMAITPLGASLPLSALGGPFGASPGTEHLHGARAEGEYKSFKTANVFFFFSLPILGEEKQFFLQLSSLSLV